jgi:hypothetical protein
MEDSKYVVFHREYHRQWMDEWPEVNPEEEPREIEDAVVIRRQDVFAASALFSYANSIRTATEIMEMERAARGGDRTDLDEMVDRLNEIADYFVGQAELASKSASKIPD